MRWRSACLALPLTVTLTACASVPSAYPVNLTVAGPPLTPAQTERPFFYEIRLPAEGEVSGGVTQQDWSRLGREDRAAQVPGDREYAARACPARSGAILGRDAVLDAIVDEAARARVLIVNESHHLTRHREISRLLAERLRPLGYTVFAAETFNNTNDGPDPVESLRDVAYPHRDIGWYTNEPVFGRLLREVKARGYRLAAYEQVHGTSDDDNLDRAARIAAREQAQAENLAAILAGMGPEEKLFVHVGYGHADESTHEDGSRYMAARLRELTGIDPLTIGQTICRGGADDFRLLPMPRDENAPFDYALDHPIDGFRHGRAAWRFDDAQAVAIPEAFASASEALVIEAFREGEPFDAVPEDRVYIEPGEDVRLALPAGRYIVRAVRLTE